MAPGRIFFVFASIIWAATDASARTWYVTSIGGGDAPTIQAAINSSASGDTVLVAAGAYDENLVIPVGLDLVLRSESGAEETIVDGGRRGSVLIVRGTGIVEALTLRNGMADFGAGVSVFGSQRLVLRANVIADNDANTFDVGSGGGVFLHLDTNGIVVELNTIRDNYAGHAGGGIWAHGGLSGAPPVVRGNRILDNHAKNGGGGVAIARGSVEQNLILNNEALTGGGITTRQTTVTIRNNTIAGNRIELRGTGAGIDAGGSAIITHNIVAFNTDAGGHGVAVGIRCVTLGTPIVECNDVWGNDNDDIVCNNAIETGNFSTDPRFCNAALGDFSLQAGSPCLPGTNSNCALVGALPVGCAAVAVQKSTWSSLKIRYR